MIITQHVSLERKKIFIGENFSALLIIVFEKIDVQSRVRFESNYIFYGPVALQC